MADLTGKTLGKFRLTERLGQGGMAEVYKAYQPRLDRYVAIKLLHGFLASGEGFLERFEREAKAVASLRHPNIVLVHDFDVEDETYFMVMEFVDGHTLKERIQSLSGKGQYMPAEEVLSIIQQVASALDYAHQQGLIHRDIKPANILIDNNRHVFLTDFGIAHIVSDSQFTATGALVGTPAYMSPEQGKGEKVTSVSDIYSLGIILYQLLTGRVPFDADTPLAVIHKHVHEVLPMPRKLNPALSEGFERVILKALAKDTDDRYQTAAELMKALEQASEASEPIVMAGVSAEAMPTAVFSGEEKPGETFEPADATPAVESQTEKIQAREHETPAPDPDMLPTQIGSSEEGFAELERDISLDRTVVDEEIGELDPASKSPLVKDEERSESVGAALESKPGQKPNRLVPILGVVGVLVVIVILAMSGVFGGGDTAGEDVDCGSPEECIQMAWDMNGQPEAIAYADRAISMVAPEPRFAFLWCERGGLLESLGDLGPAADSFQTCLEWTGDDPEQEGMRNWAIESLERLQ